MISTIVSSAKILEISLDQNPEGKYDIKRRRVIDLFDVLFVTWYCTFGGGSAKTHKINKNLCRTFAQKLHQIIINNLPEETAVEELGKFI